MIKHEHWRASNVVGTALLFWGLVPFILWVLDYIDVIRPGHEPTAWGIILMGMAMLALGGMLVKGKGDSISDAFMSWFRRRTDA